MEKMSYSIEEAATVIGSSRSVVYREVNTGRLKSFHIGARHFISAEAIRQYIAEREAEAASQRKETA